MSGSSPVGDGCAASQIASAIVTPSMWSMISPYSSLQSLGNGNCTKLRAFTVGGCRWFIEYCPNGCCADDSDWISVRVCRDDTSDAKDVTVYVMISLLYPHEKTVSSKTSDTLGFNGRCGFHRLIRMKYLENSMFFGDDSLIVMCHITVVTETPATQFVVARPSDLHQHLLGLLTSGQGGEVTFVVGGETFAAHRYMLATRSSVFMAGLFGPMKKKKKKTATTIRIDGMEAKVFKAMLHYIYTDSFPKFEAGETMEMAQHLLVAADRYNIEGLKLICEDTLRCYIGTSTAATMLALAEQHSCHELREACFKFMSSLNNLKAVMATYGFKHLKSVCPSILEELVAKNSFQGVGSGAAAGGRGGGHPYGSTFGDQLCSLNLKETSEFVRSSFPMATMARSNSSNGTGAGHGYHHETSTTSSSSSSTASAHRRRAEQQQVPGTPGRPLLFLAASSSSPAHHQLVSARRSVPSKWEDAEKWLRQSADHRGHQHGKISNLHNGGLVRRATGEEKTAQARRSSLDSVDASTLALYTSPAEVLLKDRFTDNVEPSKESFVFQSSYCEPAKVSAAAADDLCRRDIGTEMTPLGSSRTSRCHTPIKSTSPARHNTPTGRSGPLVPYNNGNGMDISELTDCHFAKLELGTEFDAMLVNWSSKEEEEEEVSKSLRHFEASVGSGVVACDKRAGTAECRWEDDERTKSCIRYQREEAKIQAWINLESAKAEAQSRKLELKIQKMRSNLEEKLMKRMTTVHRRGEEWRTAAQAQHLQQLKRATTDHARRVRTISHHLSGSNTSCGCFPCNNNIISGNLLKY